MKNLWSRVQREGKEIVMPIGGSSYYNKSKKTAVAPRDTNNMPPPPVAPTQAINNAPAPPPVQETAIQNSNRMPRPAKRRSQFGEVVSRAPMTTYSAPPAQAGGGLDDIVSQVLELAQKVHAIAQQAEIAIVRAEAAMVKAELCVARAEAAAALADGSSNKVGNAVARAETAAQKAEMFTSRAELAATKAGLAAGKAELSAGSRGQGSQNGQSSNGVSAGPPLSIRPHDGDSNDAPEAYSQTRDIESPLDEIAMMSRKLRSGMREIERMPDPSETSDSPASGGTYGDGPNSAEMAASGHGNPALQALAMATGRSPFAIKPVGAPQRENTLQREAVANGLVSVDQEASIPIVAPFIIQSRMTDRNEKSR